MIYWQTGQSECKILPINRDGILGVGLLVIFAFVRAERLAVPRTFSAAPSGLDFGRIGEGRIVSGRVTLINTFVVWAR